MFQNWAVLLLNSEADSLGKLVREMWVLMLGEALVGIAVEYTGIPMELVLEYTLQQELFNRYGACLLCSNSVRILRSRSQCLWRSVSIQISDLSLWWSQAIQYWSSCSSVVRWDFFLVPPQKSISSFPWTINWVAFVSLWPALNLNAVQGQCNNLLLVMVQQ